LRTLGPKGQEVMGEWRNVYSQKMHIQKINNLYPSPNTVSDELKKYNLGEEHSMQGAKKIYIQNLKG